MLFLKDKLKHKEIWACDQNVFYDIYQMNLTNESGSPRSRRYEFEQSNMEIIIAKLSKLTAGILKANGKSESKVTKGEMVPIFSPEHKQQNSEMWRNRIVEIAEILSWKWRYKRLICCF